MIQRPKKGETEEDLLRQEEEFLKASGKQSALKRKTEPNAPKVSKQIEILGDIKEKTHDVSQPVELGSKQTKGFPKLFEIDSTLVSKRHGKKSLFALQLAKNKKLKKNNVEVDEGISTPEVIENFVPNYAEESRIAHEENIEKLSKLSEEEILEEQKKILSTLDPKLIEFLKSRGKEKSKMPKDVQEESLKIPETNEELVKKNIKEYLGSKWVNMDFLEKEKLEWIGDIPGKKSLEPDQPYSARFDFKGDLQPFSAEIDVRNSLYHHGEEPHRPGYTIQELYQLSRSHVLQQRNIALITLGNIIRKTKLGYYDKCFDGQLLHKLVECDLFFLLRFSIDEDSLVSSSIYCLYNLIYNETDEFCLDKLLGVSYTDEQPLLFDKMEMNKDEEKELKDHIVIGCDLIKGMLRTDLLLRLAYVLSNLSPTRETIIRIISCLIRISRHSLEATMDVFQTQHLLKAIYKYIRMDASIYEGVKLFRLMLTHSKKVALNIAENYDFMFLFYFFEAEESTNILKKEFYLLKLETLYFWRGLLLHDIFVDGFIRWTPCLIRFLLFYTEKVDISEDSEFDFELFSAMTSLIITGNQKKLYPNSNIPKIMRICLKKWLTQLKQHRKYNFAVSKALGCAFRYFISYFKAFGVSGFALEFIKEINFILFSLFQSEAFDEISSALIKQSHVLSLSRVNRDPDNLPSLCSVYNGGYEFLRIVTNSSPLPFFLSVVKYLKIAFLISLDSKPLIKLFVNSKNIQKYVSKICELNEIIYNWFMKFEMGFLIDFLKLLSLLNDKRALNLGFCLLPLLRVDDQKSKQVLKILCDKNIWKVKVSFLDNLPPLYSDLLLQNREGTEVLNYKNNLLPEDWPFKILSHLRGKESVEEVRNVLRFLSLILTLNPHLIKRSSYTYRFYNLCFVFLTDSNVFDTEIQKLSEIVFQDVLANKNRVNLNKKFDKNKSFYDLYTELITQYAGVSYGLRLFAKLVMFPLQNRFNVSFKKLLWFEYLHVLRVVTLPYPVDKFIELEDFVEPCETDESLLVAYLNSVSNNVITKSRNGFVYNIAIANIRNFLRSTNHDEKLLLFLRKKINELENEKLKNDILNFEINSS